MPAQHAEEMLLSYQAQTIELLAGAVCAVGRGDGRGRALRQVRRLIFSVLVLCAPAICRAAPVLFDFNGGPQLAPLPLDLTVGGVTAHFSATGQGFSIQDTAQAILVLPAEFSGLGIVPSSVFPADLLVDFPQTLIKDFSILVAPQELNTDTTATLRVTAYRGGTLVGTNTSQAAVPGLWPSSTLSFADPQGFDRVVIHYDSPPPTGGDYGPIFVADNMLVTPAPEPNTALLATIVVLGLAACRRRRAT
jgi:hypothetical protein